MQRLSPTARRDKLARDRAYMDEVYRDKKAFNQKERRAAIKDGQNITGKDYDHKTKRFVSIKANRGNRGKGTKSEG